MRARIYSWHTFAAEWHVRETLREYSKGDETHPSSRNATGEERKAFGSTLVTMVTQQGALTTSVYAPDISSSCDKRFSTRQDRARKGSHCCPKIYPSTRSRSSWENTIWSTTSFGNYYWPLHTKSSERHSFRGTFWSFSIICALFPLKLLEL